MAHVAAFFFMYNQKGECMNYLPATERYEKMKYNRCGKSGLMLPAVSLGMWHNFGAPDSRRNALEMLKKAFDLGITHLDLANNYGPPTGAAEEMLGSILEKEMSGLRDELVISTKAGWPAWPGPYGDRGSRKYLIASLDQSLARLGLDYVDIYYHHRPDPETPIEETMGAMDTIVKQGKALYIGISSYSPDQTEEAAAVAKDMGFPLVIHQPSYSMFNRKIEEGLQDSLERTGMGSIVFSPLAQGLLTDRYLNGIPEDSRVKKDHGALWPKHLNEETMGKVKKLNEIASERGQSLAQMALAWVLRDGKVTSVLIGASKPEQIEENVGMLEKLEFAEDELAKIEEILKD